MLEVTFERKRLQSPFSGTGKSEVSNDESDPVMVISYIIVRTGSRTTPPYKQSPAHCALELDSRKRLLSNTLTQPSPSRERAFRGVRIGDRFAPNNPLSLGGEEWRKRSGGSFYQPLGEGVNACWRLVRTLWYTLIRLRLGNELPSLRILLPRGRREWVGHSGRFLAINNSCRIASNTPSKLSFTSLFQNRITRNPNASSTAVRAASISAISAC